MSVEKDIEKMEQEIKALKASFEQSASMMKIYSTQITFSTSMNSVTYSNPSYNPLQWESLVSMPRIDANTHCGVETIVVTFTCSGGINTFATLEIEELVATSGLGVITTTRVPYNGGARWLVTAQPNVTLQPSGWYTWQPTKLRFVVKSAVEGQLGAKMIWE